MANTNDRLQELQAIADRVRLDPNGLGKLFSDLNGMEEEEMRGGALLKKEISSTNEKAEDVFALRLSRFEEDPLYRCSLENWREKDEDTEWGKDLSRYRTLTFQKVDNSEDLDLNKLSEKFQEDLSKIRELEESLRAALQETMLDLVEEISTSNSSELSYSKDLESGSFRVTVKRGSYLSIYATLTTNGEESGYDFNHFLSKNLIVSNEADLKEVAKYLS